MGIWDKFYEKARSFFTGGEEGTSESTATKTRCYYDLLEVDREAGEDEIKKSFKKLALKWHPDKNPGKEEECAAYFILIQQAYEVLSDPQERAFYDRHRENIIYQNTDGPDERKDDGTVLEPFMCTGCWRSGIFANEEERQEKFYSVYRDLFHQLAAEEYAYIEDPEERNYPVFGTFTSDYETVVAPFYAFWLNFSTRRSFAWLDKWNMREASDRQTARYMEKENRKNREHGRKLRSDEIRKLVEFVRKHDKRVELARQRQKERNEAIQKKVEEQRRQAIRRNLEKLETFEMDEEAEEKHLMDLEQIEAALDAQFGTVNSATTAGDEESGGEDGASGDGSADGEDGGEFRCIVCEKTFKSRNVLDNHQRSRKHRQMVELLRTHMREEDQQLFEEENVDGSSQEDEEVQPQRRGKRKKKRKGGAAKLEDEEKEEENRPKMEDEAKNGEKKEAAQNDGPEEEMKPPPTVKSKKARRRAACGGSGTTGGGTDGGKNNKPTGPVACECITCGAEFDSKSQLHAHLKSSGHAVLKTVQTAAAKPTATIGTEGGGGGKKGGKVKNNRRNKEREE